MTTWRSNDLPAHFAPGAMAAAARWTVGGDADTPPGGADPSRSDDADGHDWGGYGE